MQPTALQSRLASRILAHARLSGWREGHHLTEDSLLPVLGASRTPVRAAMALLERQGVLEKRPNRGFFLRALPDDAASGDETGEADRIYVAIAMDRLSRALPDAVSENEFIRRYSLSRAQLRIVLARIAGEGWIERRPGRGWAFLPLIDTLDAYRENYRFRQMLEPAAMLSPEFRPDPARIEQLEAQQRAVLDGGYAKMSQVELFATNSRFHEALAEMGGNRFVVQALVRVNQLRRLIEYGRPLDRERARRVCAEHLAILAALKTGHVMIAAQRLQDHLANAKIEKAPATPQESSTP